MSFVRYLSQSHIKFLFKIWFSHLAILFVLRCVFYWANHPQGNTPEHTTDAYFAGFRFDNVILCYILFIPFLLLTIASFIKEKKILFWISFNVLIIEILIIELITCANIPYYKQFGSVISKNAFLWDSSPGMMFGLIFSSFGYWGYLILFAAVFTVSFILMKSFFYQLREDAKEFPQHKTGFKLLAFILIGIYLFLGARGTTSHKTTIHRGFATVSDNTFVNSIGLNPCFVFFKSYLSKKEGDSYSVPQNINTSFAEVKKYLGVSDPDPLTISRNKFLIGSEPNKYNVIVVLMESMSTCKMGFFGEKVLTPSFNDLIKESVLFDRFYSSGIHTFNGIFSTVTGFPSIYTEHSLVKYNQKPFNGMGTQLKKNNYLNYFFTTHDPKFDNMEGFLKLNGYKNIVGEFDFPSSEAISTLGIPDHLLFDHVIERINKDKTEQPFHALILTSSDHGPWTVPGNIPFKPDAATEEQRATQYADWAIGYFMQNAKKQKWYNNTVFLFLGDHGYYVDRTYQMPLSYNNIPLVVHCPALLKTDTISNVGYQPDVFPTVMGLLNISYTNESFGVDLFREKHPYVFFSADDKYGIMNDNGFYYFDLLESKERHLRNGSKIEEKEYYNEKKVFADSMEMNAANIIETARYIIHQNYYNK